MSDTAPAPSPWPFRLSLGALLSALPLFLFGGTITTIGAGMAVQGWWDAEGHFMPFFPIDKWLRDFGTFVEHTHRQFGMVVGFFALAAAIASFATGARGAVRSATTIALLAVIGQGTLGGFRVLENSPELAFLHGFVAQGVFAALAAAVVISSERWRTAEPAGSDVATAGLRGWTWLLALVIYGQIGLGCWYRHGLRNMVGDGVTGRLHLHLAVAFAVLAVVVAVARQLEAAANRAGAGAAGDRLGSLKKRLHILVGIQILLGFLAWWAYDVPAPGDPKTHGEFEITLSVLHVLVGALLLAQSVTAALWTGRLAGARSATLSAPAQGATS